MSLNKISSFFYKLSRFIRDVNAISKGRPVKRVTNKLIGRKAVSKLWKK
jgi:hypothetical protein